MQKLYVGCSGWSYDGWLGHFYPSNLERKDSLKYYSQVFDFVEIDSSFYNAPNILMTKRWASITPDNFRFTAKFPRLITHEKRLASPDSEKELHYFFDVMRPLRVKLLTLLLQLPPSLTAKEGLKKLEALIHLLDPEFRYAIEVRHKSWFDRKERDSIIKRYYKEHRGATAAAIAERKRKEKTWFYARLIFMLFQMILGGLFKPSPYHAKE